MHALRFWSNEFENAQIFDYDVINHIVVCPVAIPTTHSRHKLEILDYVKYNITRLSISKKNL